MTPKERAKALLSARCPHGSNNGKALARECQDCIANAFSTAAAVAAKDMREACAKIVEYGWQDSEMRCYSSGFASDIRAVGGE